MQNSQPSKILTDDLNIQKPINPWVSFFAIANEMELDEDGKNFMNERPMNRIIKDKDIFSDDPN